MQPERRPRRACVLEVKFYLDIFDRVSEKLIGCTFLMRQALFQLQLITVIAYGVKNAVASL
jgi:hypothetical protein